VSAGDSQQAAPPPPSPGSGSPFGRFKTIILTLGSTAAVGVSLLAAAQYAGDGGGGSPAGPAPSGIVGSWEGADVRLEVTPTGGTLRRSGCSGTLALRTAGDDEAVYRYTDTSGRRGCPRRKVVRLSLVGPDALRIEGRRGASLETAETLARRAG
jgi:hypothetical protein